MNVIEKKEHNKLLNQKYREYRQNYYKQNKKRYQQYHKDYKEKNKEKLSQYSKEYYVKNKDRILKYHLDRRRKKPPTLRILWRKFLLLLGFRM